VKEEHPSIYRYPTLVQCIQENQGQLRIMLRIVLALSFLIVAKGLVPAPLFWNQSTAGGSNAGVLRTIHPGNFRIITDSSFLHNGALKRISNWFRLPDQFIDEPVNPDDMLLEALTQLHVTVASNDTTLVQGVDESYKLEIPDQHSIGGCGCATLRSKTVFGALRGLETLAQLLDFGWIEEESGQATFVVAAPQTIHDAPSYSYRGLLIDTSRHYLPTELIISNLDAMAMNKVNVLHWHMTDSQSWPYQSERYPELSEYGAYRPTGMVYSAANIRRIVQEAYYRGIRVIPEFDLPGHSYSIGKSHPEWMSHCPDWDEPIDPTQDGVYEFIGNLYKEIFELFPSDMVHLGGDEVPLDCWKKDPSIQQWMTKHNIPGEVDLFELFEQKLLEIVAEKKAIVWQEVYDLGINISKQTIVDVWKDWGNENTLFNATKAGYQVILSSCWYLDHLSDNWHTYYECDPRALLNGAKTQEALILGGHASMWGEHVDASNFMSRVWPRASAMAERLWSGKAADDIDSRMATFRCHMVRRGIDAGPTGPGFCGKEPKFNMNQASSSSERTSHLRHGDSSDEDIKA
jgi:hexosaminidase